MWTWIDPEEVDAELASTVLAQEVGGAGRNDSEDYGVSRAGRCAPPSSTVAL